MPNYNEARLAPFTLLDEPELSFRPDDSRRDVNPLRGLSDHGPYSSDSFSQYVPRLRLATIAPTGGVEGLRQLLQTLRGKQQPGDRLEYVPPYPGFEKLFGVPLGPASKEAHFRWPDDLQALAPDGTPQQRLMHGIRDVINRLILNRDQFDAVFIHLPDTWKMAFRGVGFDVHDSIKALCAGAGIPTQVINDRAFTFPYKASLA
ncbi:MAG: nuclease PIN, partial [Burkholderiales bacterium]